MTIIMKLHDGRKLRKQTFENVTAGKAYAELHQNFWGFIADMKWGVFEVIKDGKTILVDKFGSK